MVKGERSISGTVYADTDKDGTGDIPLSGVSVLARYAGAWVQSKNSNINGEFTFNNLAPLGHTIQLFYVPSGYARPADQSIDLSGGDGSATIVLVGTRGIAGTVMVDTDGDGTPDAGVNGVVVAVFNENANEVTSMTVDTDGAFTFDGLAPREYTLTFAVPGGYVDLVDETVDLSGGNAAGIVIEAFVKS